MAKGEVQMTICVEEKGPKVHDADVRSMARHRRFVYISLFAALLPFLITRSYLYYTTSDASAGFFEGKPAPASQGEDAPNDVVITPPVSAPTDHEEIWSSHDPGLGTNPPGNLTTDHEEISPSHDPELEINPPGNLTTDHEEISPSHDPELETTPPGNLTSRVGGEADAEEPKSNAGPPSLSSKLWNSTSNGSLSIDTEIGKNASNTSYLESWRGSTQNTSEGAEAGGAVMEGATAPSPAQKSLQSLAVEGECQFERGQWVPDSTPPLYNSSTCKYIQAHQNCHKNGRPDDGYLYWKWKPEGQCNLPRMNPTAFLMAMRNRSVVFAGDSIARNQFQSLLCMLSQAEAPRHTYWSEDGRDNVYHFQLSNVTLTVRWSPYLVRVQDKSITWPDNTTETVSHIYVDELDPMWVTAVGGAEILHISTGQWWYKRAVYLENKTALGCHGCPSCELQRGFHIPYSKAIRNVLLGSSEIPGFNGTTVFRSFSPEHFENGAWDNGGACVRTAPGGVPMSYDTTTLYDIQKQQFQNVTDAIGKDRLKLLGITELAQSRADAHPNKYRSEEQKKSEASTNGVPNDCLHWCLPGPIDTWNDLLVHSLHDVIFK